LQAQAGAQALESRLKGISVADTADSAEPEEPPDVVKAGSGSDSEDDLFGNMLEEPDPEAAPTQQTEDPDSTMQIRSMPVPKSFAFSGNIPKAMLKAALAKTSKPASVSYIKLSGYSRAIRVGLEISWTSERRRVWKMDEIACDDLVEAENYVATLALSELSARGEIGGVNWRAMPPEYRELWEELETQRGEEVKVEKRQFWAKIRDISSQQTSALAPSAPLDSLHLRQKHQRHHQESKRLFPNDSRQTSPVVSPHHPTRPCSHNDNHFPSHPSVNKSLKLLTPLRSSS
jgi:ATP-dependent RNA helicase DHX29